MRLVQITCEAPPALGGIAQYLGGLLAREAGAGVETSRVFAVSSSDGVAAPGITQVPMATLGDSVVEHLRTRSGEARVLLHYSGYGYDSTGAPAGLLAEVAKIRRAANIRVTTLFHEVHASGYPWQRSFWLCPAQIYVARQLALRSDLCLCTSERSRARLLRISGLDEGRVRAISIPATVGEPELVPEWTGRRDVCLLFGRREPKEALLAAHWKEICRFLQRLGVRELRDLGSPVRRTPAKPGPGEPEVTPTNETSNAAIAREFATAKFFLVETPVDLLDKSTVFANGIAHGCVPLWVKPLAAANPLLLDSIALGRSDLFQRLPQISASARDFYQSHRSWAVHWNVLRESLFDGAGHLAQQVAAR